MSKELAAAILLKIFNNEASDEDFEYITEIPPAPEDASPIRPVQKE